MIKKMAAILLAMIFIISFSGCNKLINTSSIDDNSSINSLENQITTQQTGGTIIENMTSVPETQSKNFRQQFEIEDFGGADAKLTENEGFTGDGYIKLEQYELVTITVEVPVSQHYNVGLTMISDESTVTLTSGGTSVKDNISATYKVINGTIHDAYQAKKVSKFTTLWLNSLYLDSGKNRLTFQVIKGSALLDNALVEDGENVPETYFTRAKSNLSNKNSNDLTVEIMLYLKDTYGKNTLTGQYCTPNTNAELEAIYQATGRYPAIRCGDLMYYTSKGKDKATGENCEVQLAADWAKNGGLVSFSWYWFAPLGNGEIYSDKTNFKLENAVTDVDVATLTTEELDILTENDRISSECYALLADIDAIGAQLSLLQEKGVTVLWRPLPEAGNGWYWWGNCDSGSYKWLWRVMYNRLTTLHKLNNLIWVWNGENSDFFVGDSYLDIYSEDCYNETQATNITRILRTSNYSPNVRMVALSECAVVPSPDDLVRDNCKWLWFAVWSGDYMIFTNGIINEKYTTAKQLQSAYNHEFTITLDELPSFGQ